MELHLLMFGTCIECLVWYAAAQNLAAVEQPQLWNIWYFEQHTVHYKYIMFNTIGLKINVATILCVIEHIDTAELYTICHT